MLATGRSRPQRALIHHLDLPIWAKGGAVLAGTALLAVAARISVPMVPVPMSLQTYAVLVIGALYGSRWGALTVLVYLAEAAVGLPVLAEGASGVSALYGPTSGYLLGFLVAAIVVGRFAETGWEIHGLRRCFGAMLLAHGIILFLGVVRLSWLESYDLGQAVAAGATPFIAGAVAKSALALLTVEAFRRARA